MGDQDELEKAVDAARGIVPVSADELRCLPGRLLGNPVETFRALCELTVEELRALCNAFSHLAANAYSCMKGGKNGG